MIHFLQLTIDVEIYAQHRMLYMFSDFKFMDEMWYIKQYIADASYYAIFSEQFVVDRQRSYI